MVNQAAFNDFITHNFVEKRRNGSKVITRTKGTEITAYLSDLKSMEDAHFKFWVKSRGFKLNGLSSASLSAFDCITAEKDCLGSGLNEYDLW